MPPKPNGAPASRRETAPPRGGEAAGYILAGYARALKVSHHKVKSSVLELLLLPCIVTDFRQSEIVADVDDGAPTSTPPPNVG